MGMKVFRIPGLKNFTGEALIYFEHGKPVRGFALRKDQFVTSFRAIEEAKRKAGVT